jgi:mono/diheme cytochrome c family protein
MERIGKVILSIIIVTFALASGRMEAQETNQAGKGLALAQKVCAECHAIDKRQVRSPNPAAPRFEAVANSPGMSAIAVAVALQTSHPTMPNLMLDSDELRNIAAYILSLK